MKHAIVNLGCKVNRVEADAFERLLQNAGSVPASEADADVIVVNTCTVTGDAEKKTRKAVRHALRESAAAQVVVTGCAAAIDPDAFAAMDARITVVSKAEVEPYLRTLVAEREDAGERGMEPVLGRQRIGVKVQDGCDNACTYCIVHVARGPARSRDEEAIVADTVRLAENGVREILLTGINLGAYGRDRDSGSLSTLLRRLLAETSTFLDQEGRTCRLRLSSIEPADVNDELLETIAAADGRICRHLHLPLQAGSTKVLEEMARPYTAQEFLRLIERTRKLIPRIALSTDIIVGFPGETEEDFEQTMELCEACGFSLLHVFPYSRREGTPAAGRIDQIEPKEKSERAARLRVLGGALRKADRIGRLGTAELALVERPGYATTESYHDAVVPSTAPVGSLVPYLFS